MTLQAVTKYLLTIYPLYSSARSTQDLRRIVSTNNLNLESRRQELELRKAEMELKKEEEEIRAKQLANEKLELDLMERRLKMQGG